MFLNILFPGVCRCFCPVSLDTEVMRKTRNRATSFSAISIEISRRTPHIRVQKILESVHKGKRESVNREQVKKTCYAFVKNNPYASIEFFCLKIVLNQINFIIENITFSEVTLLTETSSELLLKVLTTSCISESF